MKLPILRIAVSLSVGETRWSRLVNSLTPASARVFRISIPEAQSICSRGEKLVLSGDAKVPQSVPFLAGNRGDAARLEEVSPNPNSQVPRRRVPRRCSTCPRRSAAEEAQREG